MPIGKERNKCLIQAKAPGTAIPGAFFMCFYGTRTEASCCYLFPSNHLLIQWQAIPAMTETKNEINISNTSIPPFCCQIEGSNTIIISQNSVCKKQKLEHCNREQGDFAEYYSTFFRNTLVAHKKPIKFYFKGCVVLQANFRRDYQMGLSNI